MGRTERPFRGWKGALEYLGAHPNVPRTAGDVAGALGITVGAAWVLLERCRLFSNLRSRKEGGKRFYTLTEKGKKLVKSGFQREKA